MLECTDITHTHKHTHTHTHTMHNKNLETFIGTNHDHEYIQNYHYFACALIS